MSVNAFSSAYGGMSLHGFCAKLRSLLYCLSLA